LPLPEFKTSRNALTPAVGAGALTGCAGALTGCADAAADANTAEVNKADTIFMALTHYNVREFF
jgi:hypothetical protein